MVNSPFSTSAVDLSFSDGKEGENSVDAEGAVSHLPRGLRTSEELIHHHTDSIWTRENNRKNGIVQAVAPERGTMRGSRVSSPLYEQRSNNTASSLHSYAN